MVTGAELANLDSMPNVRRPPKPCPVEYIRPAPQRVLHSWVLARDACPTPPNLESALAKPPNFKQEKKRREDAQKKRNEAKQRENAARKENTAPKEPQKP
jgi:hypothetical protein